MTAAIKIGQIWREVAPRAERYVRIEGISKLDICILTVVQVPGGKVTGDKDNLIWIRKNGTRPNLSSTERFNGKRGGYALHEDVTP